MIRKGVNLENAEKKPPHRWEKIEANKDIVPTGSRYPGSPRVDERVRQNISARNDEIIDKRIRNDKRLQMLLKKYPEKKKEIMDEYNRILKKHDIQLNSSYNKSRIIDELIDRIESGKASEKTSRYMFDNYTMPKSKRKKQLAKSTDKIAKNNEKKRKSFDKELSKTEESVNDLRLQVFEAYESGAISEDEKYTFLDYLNLDNYE